MIANLNAKHIWGKKMSDDDDQLGSASRQSSSERVDASMIDRAVKMARKQLEVANSRTKLPYADLFSDPAWLILLDMYVREHLGAKTTGSSAYVSSHTYENVAHRYVNYMTDRLYLVRETDPIDESIINLVLSDNVRNDLTRILGSSD